MNGLYIKIKQVDQEELTEPLRPRVIVAFEQQFGKGFGKLLEDQKIEHMYWLAWRVLQAKGVVVKTFGPEFLDTLEAVELTEDPSSDSTATV